MIRDEAKQEWAKVHPLDLDLDSVIDVIYDDFESRCCGNCKYFTSSPNTNKYDCCEKGISDASISFCCNKWESK